MSGVVFLDYKHVKGDRFFIAEVVASGPDMAEFARNLNREVPSDQRIYAPPGLGEYPKWALLRKSIPSFMAVLKMTGFQLEVVRGPCEKELRKIEREQARRTTDPRRGKGRGRRGARWTPPTSGGAHAPARCPFQHDEAFESMYLTPNVPEEVAKVVFKVLCLRNHPDRGGSEDKMKKLNQTWDGIRAKRGWA